MLKTLYIVPVANFVIENVFRVGEFIFSPTMLWEEENDFTDTVTKSEYLQIASLVNNISNKFPDTRVNSSFILFEDVDVKVTNPQESFLYVNKISEKADKALDYFRVNDCLVGKYDTLPGIAGITLGGFKIIFKANVESNEVEILTGEVVQMIRSGIGLMPSNEPSLLEYTDSLYKVCFSDRSDMFFQKYRNAIHRVSEAMYMTNINTSFIYLMSTIEMLASSEYIQFKQIKPKIIPFIADDKKEYYEMSDFFTELSRPLREGIVHNGKSLYDFYESENEIRNLLFHIQMIIVDYVINIVELNIDNEEELENCRNKLKLELGI